MSQTRSLAQRCEPLEKLIPRRYRLPFRYGAQRLVGALEPEMVVLPSLVAREGAAVDIGANRGIYAYALSRVATHVHSFEPLLECCEYIEDYGSSKITVRNVALSDKAGEFELFIPIDGGRRILTRASLEPVRGPHEHRRITVMRLDDFDLGPVAFIKIDVEGAEFPVLKGAVRTLRSHAPNLLIEIDRSRHDGHSFRAILEWLTALGYEPNFFAAGSLQKCTDPWLAPEGVFNFIFLPCQKNHHPKE